MNSTVASRARRVLGAASLAGAVLLAVAPGAHAAAPGAAYVLSDVQCATDGGVLDLTLVNDDPSAPAVFRVAGGSAIEVAPLSASALTYTGLGNGTFEVAVEVDGTDASVAVAVSCVTTQVESLAGSRDGSEGLPATGGETSWGLLIGGGLVAAGIAASLVARRRYS